jgi:hypothetical protein
MRITKIEQLLIFDNAIIAGLMYYIFSGNIKASVICFVITLIVEIAIYYFISKVSNKKNISADKKITRLP